MSRTKETQGDDKGAWKSASGTLVKVLVSDQVLQAEEKERAADLTRTSVTVVRRLVDTYCAAGWAIVYSDGRVVGALADDKNRLPSVFAEYRQALGEHCGEHMKKLIVARHQRIELKQDMLTLAGQTLLLAVDAKLMVKVIRTRQTT